MSRLAPLDKALVWILVPLWAVCFALSLATQLGGSGIALVGLSVPSDESYPVVTGQSSFSARDPLATAGLRAGDRLMRVGGTDLRGVGTVGFAGRAREESGRELEVPIVYERGSQRRDTSLALSPISAWRSRLAPALAFAASGLFLLLRARPTPTARAYFQAAFCAAFAGCMFAGSALELYAFWGLNVLATSLLIPLMVRFAFLFPDGRAPESRWHRVWPWLFVVFGLFNALDFVGLFDVGEAGSSATLGLGCVTFLAVLTYKSRQGGPIAGRQFKWILFGIYCAVVPVAVAGILAAIEPGLSWLHRWSFWATPLFPASLLVAVALFNLFDIDRLLSATASYNILLVLLGAGALAIVPRLAEAGSGFVGIDAVTSQALLSLALAALIVPAHRRLRPQIDRVFFKERYALDHGIAELLPILSKCPDTPSLAERAGAGLHLLLRPEVCAIYARVEQSYAAVFVEGRAVPPAFEAESPLIATLRGRSGPLSLSDVGRRPDEARLGPFDRAAMEMLQAEVVVPVRSDDVLVAFLCLGPKRSGDVYTSTDLSLLAAVAETISQRLQRFDQDDVIREGREMQESLRRYVPGAVAEELSSGAELASGEREVSVLFVDIRGYTHFSESRRAEEIFSTVNRYTETVSEIVHRNRGSVVEFNGDGMMAVFGAPRQLPHKERAAVSAGREIVEAVGALPVDDAVSGPATLSVGVGVATGEAFVGNIQAVDRMIWSAIGNTTNLAARLQGLTRDLDAALVIDSTTWERASAAASDFAKRPDVPIRGRRDPQDVYVLPLN